MTQMLRGLLGVLLHLPRCAGKWGAGRGVTPRGHRQKMMEVTFEPRASHCILLGGFFSPW